MWQNLREYLSWKLKRIPSQLSLNFIGDSEFWLAVLILFLGYCIRNSSVENIVVVVVLLAIILIYRDYKKGEWLGEKRKEFKEQAIQKIKEEEGK